MKIRLFLAIALAALLVSPASARHCRSVRRVAVHCVGQVYAYQQTQYVAPAPVYVRPSPQAVAVPVGQVTDPTGFVGALNHYRAQHGLRPVGYDPSLAGWAAQNSAAQTSLGLGHHVMGPARRQNSGMGSYASMLPTWQASAPHRSALLDPTITVVGLAGSGSYWTFNAR